jgi:hypothetical protein
MLSKDGDPYLLAFGAHERAPVLALEQVDDDAVVALEVAVPARTCERTHLARAAARPIRLFDVRLLQDAVQVLVQPVEQERDELLRVVLLVARKLRREALQRLLELARRVRRRGPAPGPHAVQERAERLGDRAVHPERVVRVELVLVHVGCRVVSPGEKLVLAYMYALMK